MPQDPSSSETKQCKRCLEVKSVDDFHRHPTNPGGRQRLCKVCHNKTNVEWIHKNREEVRPKLLAYGREYYKKNKDTIKVKAKEYYLEHYDEILKRVSQRPKKLERATPPWADLEKTKEVYVEAAKLRAAGNDVQVDHIYPLEGKFICGLHIHTNLRIITSIENRTKHNKFTPGILRHQPHTLVWPPEPRK